jgi:phage terminase large subunit GpA-like protein
VQRAICAVLADPDILRVVIVKPAQRGVTKILAAYCAYAVTQLKRNVIVYHPSPNASDKFSDDDVRQMLEDSPEIAKHLLVDDPNKRDPKNKNRRRSFMGGLLWMLPGATAGWFRGYTGDDIIVDDADGMPAHLVGQSGENEGDVTQKAEGRAKASSRPKFMHVSTPTVETGYIWEAAKTCDEQFRRELRCPYPDCDEWQYLEFNPLIDAHLSPKEREKNPPMHGFMWNDVDTTRKEKIESSRYVCKHCQQSIAYESFPWMDRHGRWKSENYLIDDDGNWYLHDMTPLTGDAKPKGISVAMFWDGLISYDDSWYDLLNKYLRARERKDRTQDPTPLISVINEDFARAYIEEEAQEFSINDLINRLENYGCVVPRGVLRLTLGIDLGKSFFAYQIIGIGAGLEKWVIETGRIVANPTDKNCPSWDEDLTPLAERVFQTEDNRSLPIDVVVIDGSTWTHNVKRWCAKNPRQRFCANGMGTPGYPIAEVAKPKRGEISCFSVNVGAHLTAEAVFGQLAIHPPTDHKPGTPVAGLVHFPDLPEFSEVDKETGELKSKYFSELTAEKRGHRKHKGKTYTVYECPDGKSNEEFDTYKYAAIIAVEIIETVLRRPFPVINDEQPRAKQVVSVNDVEQLAALANG